MIKFVFATFFAMILVMSLGLSALAAPRVNSGGGGWACRASQAPYQVLWLRSADLFEGEQRGLVIAATNETLSPWELLAEKRARIAKLLPRLNTLLNDHAQDLQRALISIDSPVDHTDDAELEFRPAADSCAGGLISYVQMADALIDGHVIISKPLWANSGFSHREQAAILLHEEIYFSLRQALGDENSLRSRILVSLVFSDLPDDKLALKVSQTLEDKNIDPAGDRDTVATFPVKLWCSFEVGPGIGGSADYWRAPSYGSSKTLALDGFAFTVETFAVDGTPSKIEIKDLNSGAVVGTDPYTLHKNFIGSRLLEFTLSRTAPTAVTASVTCGSDDDFLPRL